MEVYTLVYQLSFQNRVLVVSLFVWCMSGVPRVFDDEMCARDELISVVRHVCLTVN